MGQVPANDGIVDGVADWARRKLLLRRLHDKAVCFGLEIAERIAKHESIEQLEADVLAKIGFVDIRYDLTYDETTVLIDLVMRTSGLAALKSARMQRRSA